MRHGRDSHFQPSVFLDALAFAVNAASLSLSLSLSVASDTLNGRCTSADAVGSCGSKQGFAAGLGLAPSVGVGVGRVSHVQDRCEVSVASPAFELMAMLAVWCCRRADWRCCQRQGVLHEHMESLAWIRRRFQLHSSDHASIGVKAMVR